MSLAFDTLLCHRTKFTGPSDCEATNLECSKISRVFFRTELTVHHTDLGLTIPPTLTRAAVHSPDLHENTGNRDDSDLQRHRIKEGVFSHAFNPSTQKTGAGEDLYEFKPRLGYMETSWFLAAGI